MTFTSYELKALETSPSELQVLIDWHNYQESQADAMGYDEAAKLHRERSLELQAAKDYSGGETMSALAKEIENKRIKEAVGTIGRHVVTIHSLVSINSVDVECGGDCHGTLTIRHSIGLDELVKRLAEEGWSVTHTDRMLCPKCSDHAPDYWKDQVDQ